MESTPTTEISQTICLLHKLSLEGGKNGKDTVSSVYKKRRRWTTGRRWSHSSETICSKESGPIRGISAPIHPSVRWRWQIWSKVLERKVPALSKNCLASKADALLTLNTPSHMSDGYYENILVARLWMHQEGRHPGWLPCFPLVAVMSQVGL